MMRKSVRIGGGGGFWGDSPEGPVQLVERGGIDYLTMDYLAEITMSILTRMKAKRDDLGYATDFVTLMSGPFAARVAEKKIRIVTNAGGVNPVACKAALEATFASAGVPLKIALVLGDDVSGHLDSYRAAGVTEMFTGAEMPAELASANAYLGAMPIKRALDEGADIVLTGRCVDSALTLGALMHEFNWAETEYDKLAGGSLAGHIIECGTQATGGLFTDWFAVEGWSDMGFPIAICREDGSFDLTKPFGTGGLITPETVAEQAVYEVGDPAAYILPDVVCDFSAITITQQDCETVRVSGARGFPPTGTYKVSATYADGYRAVVSMMIVGRDAAAKAQKVGASILERVERLMDREGHAPFSETLIEVLGAETYYGAHAHAQDAREVTLRLGVRHPEKAALNVFAREIYPAATAMAQGLTGFSTGRPVPQPVIRLFSFLCDKAELTPTVLIGNARISVEPPLPSETATRPNATSVAETHVPQGPTVSVPLIAIAHGRSGDKGDTANIGILSRAPAFLPALRAAVTCETVARWMGHLLEGDVKRFDWPGLNGVNLLLSGALGGGGIASLRNDPQGKSYAQILLDMPVQVPAEWVADGGPLARWKEVAQ
jgi:hypothetical protein